MKKFLCIVLTITMLFGTSLFAAAAENTAGTNISWAFDASTGVLSIKGSGDMTDYTMEFNYTPWKAHTSKITSIVISDGITSVGNYAFVMCSQLKSVALPDTLKKIGVNAFSWCVSLAEIDFPESLTEIGKEAFFGCTALTEIELNSVAEIGIGAFSDCESIAKFSVSSSASAYSAKDGVLYSKDGTKLIAYPAAKSGDTFTTDGVKEIAENAFYGNRGLKNVVLKGVSKIGDYAFFSCDSLESVAFDETLDGISIGDWAFFSCKPLKEIYLPDSVKTVGEETFKNCKEVASVVVPLNITSIGADAFGEIENASFYTYGGSKAVQYFTDNKISFSYTTNVYLNGERIVFDQKPVITGDRTLIPLRAVSEGMKKDVLWDGATSTATITSGNNTVKVTIGSGKMLVNGQAIALDAPARIINGRTMVPLRALSDAFGLSVEWHDVTRSVIIKG